MKTHLLVADDEEAIRRLLTTYFRREGWEIDAVATAEETLRAIADDAIGLVVLDIELGSADGLTVLEQIKRARPGLPVVLLTGMGFDEELLLEAKRAGADGYVSKTLSLEQLKLEIQRVLRQTAA